LDRVFLDANVLYSAAYIEFSGLTRLWTFDDIVILISPYAIEEATRNLKLDRVDALPRLKRLIDAASIVDAPHGLENRFNIRIDPKDLPILMSAIHGKADYLLTGDARHFGHLYGRQIEGVLVLRPSAYFKHRQNR
jgi:predicted nucleic acid-binding protein